MNIESSQIAEIVSTVIKRLEGVGEGSKNTASSFSEKDGIFSSVEKAVSASARAFEIMREKPLALREKIIEAMRNTAVKHAADLAEKTVAETGLGRVEDKVIKNQVAAEKTPGTEDIQPVAVTGDYGLTLTERAPWGVTAAIAPTTNPIATIVNNSISLISGGNSVVFNPHPRAMNVSSEAVALLSEAIQGVGGPAGLIASILPPTIESAQNLMKHNDVKMVVVTGGPAVANYALSLPKKVVSAGPGNPPVVVDETAEISKAARDIIAGAGFDNNVICVCEKTIIAVDAIADELIGELKEAGAKQLTKDEMEKLTTVVLKEKGGSGKRGVVHHDYVGRNPSALLKTIGISAPDSLRLIFAEVDENHPMVWAEQLMPFLPLVRTKNVDEAIELARKTEGGCRHTAVMHSLNVSSLTKMARVLDCNLFVKNGPSYAGLGCLGEGHTSFTIAGLTGEGISSAKHFVRERRCVLKDGFRIV